MKKSFIKKYELILLIFLIAIFLLNISIVNSEINSSNITPATGEVNPDTGLPKDAELIKDIGDQITDENITTTYLKKEWQKILEKSSFFGPIVKAIEKFNPFIEIILGMKFAFSWFFFLTLIIYIFLIVYVFRITSLFEIENKLIHLVVFILLMAGFTYYKIPKSISGSIIVVISLLNQKYWWMQFIIITLVILILILLTYFSNGLLVIWKKIKDRNDKNIQELEKAKLKQNIDFIDKFRKTLER